jgi:hypothetical protein
LKDIYIAIRHGTIIPKASSQNMPLNSPTSMELLRYIFKMIRMINNPINIKIKAFDRFKYISLFLISKLEVLIKNIEKSAPTDKASRTCKGCTRNIGCKNMSAPVLIKIGGKMIFFTVAGFFAAFIRINMTRDAIKIAKRVDASAKKISPFLIEWLLNTLYPKKQG